MAGHGASITAEVPLEERVLEAAVLADDGVRLQLVRALPQKSRSAPLRLRNPARGARLAPLPGSGDRTLVAVMTFDGAVSWYAGDGGAERQPLKGLPSMQRESASGISALALGEDGATAVFGHTSGGASLRRLSPEHAWERVLAARGAHHEWEKVTHVAVTPNGRLLFASTGDNMAVWSLPSSTTGDAVELLHLHGGDHQVSAVDAAALPSGASLVAVAFDSGVFQGWRVDAEATPKQGVDSAWRLPRVGAQRLVAIAQLHDGGAQGYVAAADAVGQVFLWHAGAGGALVGERPAWAATPSSMGHVASVLALSGVAGGPAWVAAGCLGEVVVLECATGQRVHNSIISGSVLALRWS